MFYLSCPCLVSLDIEWVKKRPAQGGPHNGESEPQRKVGVNVGGFVEKFFLLNIEKSGETSQSHYTVAV